MLRRVRLFRALDRSGSAALTLVAAPAGYGKTTLLATWCAEQRSPVVWITLDAGDQDPARFWTHLALAIDKQRPGVTSDALALLRAPGARMEAAVDRLLTGIANHDDPLTIVLDDLDAIGSGETLRSIARSIEWLPPSARLLVAARSDPMIGLGRLRAHRMLGEIRAAELAFTKKEAGELLLRIEGLRLSPEAVALLYERTEGWPAALYLSALWLRDQVEPDEAARYFGTSARQVADFLVEEILASVDDEMKDFLARTAVLGSFTPELCDFALERGGSRAVLADLERSNLLVTPLDGEGDWYRYHHLFEEWLRLEVTHGPDRELIHMRAAEWCRDQGLAEAAIEHAAEAGDLELIADILVESADQLVTAGRMGFVQSWVKRLPSDVLVDRPLLPAGGAMIAAVRGQPQVEVERLLVLAEQSRRERPADWRGECEAYVAIARSLSVDNVDAGASLEEAHLAVEIARTSRPELLVAALAVLARAHFFSGDVESARRAAHEAATRPEAADRPYGYVLSLGLLAAIDADAGRPAQASVWAKEAIDFAQSRGLDVWFLAFAHIGMSAALSQMGRHADAEREASRAERLRRGRQLSMAHAYAQLRLADARIERSRLRQAARVLEAARREIAEFRDPGRLPELAAAVEEKLVVMPITTPGPVEQPSAGELAVLRHLASDLSQREIGAQLFLSLNTVRTHIRSLYRKLDVHSRERAVSRAEALGLLDESDSSG